MSKFKKNIDSTKCYQVCSCGKHKSLSSSQTPYQLAQTYAWFNDRKPDMLTRDGIIYLKSYENEHGRVKEYIFGKDRD